MQRRHLLAPVAAALSAAALIVIAPAYAADPPKQKAPTKTGAKSGANVMSRDQLRACMNEQDGLQQVRAAVEREQTALDGQRSAVQAMDAELARKRAALDPADAAGAQAIEDEVVRRDQLVDVHNTRLGALRAQVKTYDDRRSGWVAQCGNKDYDEMDEAAVRKERRLAAGKK